MNIKKSFFYDDERANFMGEETTTFLNCEYLVKSNYISSKPQQKSINGKDKDILNQASSLSSQELPIEEFEHHVASKQNLNKFLDEDHF